MKTKLTLEQSARLFSLGLADNLVSSDKYFISEDKRIEYFDELEKLTGSRKFPKGVFQKVEKPVATGFSTYPLYHKIFTLDDECVAAYILYDTDDFTYVRDLYHSEQFSGVELIDALYDLLNYFLTNKYFTLDSEGYIKLPHENIVTITNH